MPLQNTPVLPLPRNKVQLLPDHGPLNWLQFGDKKATRLKIALMKIITILVTIFSDDLSAKEFIQDNALLFPGQVELLGYLSGEVLDVSEMCVEINTIKSKNLSIFEQSADDALFNGIFGKILSKVDAERVLDLFSGGSSGGGSSGNTSVSNRNIGISSRSRSNNSNSNPRSLRLRPEAVLRNYRLKNINTYWMVLNGKVYYITPYFMYHPGGESILIKILKSSRNTAERIDKYSEFQKYHRWVNEVDQLLFY